MNRAAVLTGTGSALPPRVVLNDEIALRTGSSDGWIRSRTGIVQRHHATRGMTTSGLAAAAGEAALKSAGIGAVDVVVLATTTPDQPCPGTAPAMATELGLSGVAAFDVSAVCTGFLYGLATAAGLISAEVADSALVVGAEIFSSILNPDDRSTSVIFGDGAGAVVLRAGHAGEPGALGPFHLASDGSGRDLIAVRAGGTRQRLAPEDYTPADRYFSMSGKKVFWRAVQCMAESSRAVLARVGWSVDEVDRMVCHQANARIVSQLADTLGIPRSRCFTNIDRVGNTAAASIPLALDEASRDGVLRPGERVLLTAFGGGLTWGSAVLTWPSLGCGDANDESVRHEMRRP